MDAPGIFTGLLPSTPPEHGSLGLALKLFPSFEQLPSGPFNQDVVPYGRTVDRFPTEEHRTMTQSAPACVRAAQALRRSSHPALRKLSVEETDSAIIISGRVSTYYLK